MVHIVFEATPISIMMLLSDAELLLFSLACVQVRLLIMQHCALGGLPIALLTSHGGRCIGGLWRHCQLRDIPMFLRDMAVAKLCCSHQLQGRQEIAMYCEAARKFTARVSPYKSHFCNFAFSPADVISACAVQSFDELHSYDAGRFYSTKARTWSERWRCFIDVGLQLLNRFMEGSAHLEIIADGWQARARASARRADSLQVDFNESLWKNWHVCGLSPIFLNASDNSDISSIWGSHWKGDESSCHLDTLTAHLHGAFQAIRKSYRVAEGSALKAALLNGSSIPLFFRECDGDLQSGVLEFLQDGDEEDADEQHSEAEDTDRVEQHDGHGGEDGEEEEPVSASLDDVTNLPVDH